jgi:hypothetical protein
VLAITKVQDGPNSTGITNTLTIVQLLGKMLDDKVGIYAIRLYFYDAKSEHKIGPEMIDFDR